MGKPRGFAWMKIHDPARLREISREGGRKAQQGGKAPRWTQERARAWAAEGGRAKWQRAVEKLREAK